MNSSQHNPPVSSTKLAVVILAAGAGTRMQSAIPKVLQRLAGLPLLQHVLNTVSQLQPDYSVVVIGHQAALLEDYLKNQAVVSVRQEPQLGTGHALSVALQHIPKECETILVLYGDVPLLQPATLQRLVKACAGENLAILTENVENPTGYGRIIRNNTGHVIAIREHKDASVEEQAIHEINTGIMAIPRLPVDQWLKSLSTDNAQGEYYLTDIVSLAAQNQYLVHTCQSTYNWEALGVNSASQLAQLERHYQAFLASQLLNQGVRLSDPARLDIRGQLDCDRDVSIDVGCIFEGHVVLKVGVKIGPYCVLKDCVVESHSEILAYTHVEGAEIGANNRIGPYARLRPGTTTGDTVHIGNFVETKKTILGNSTKANHLSYLGDSVVGERVNIGAGTITCNYDGVNKHQTIIEDDVFIGSDSQLVAPVTIARGSTIGAGSTIVTSTPPDQLTLSRSKQVSISRWQKPKPKKD